MIARAEQRFATAGAYRLFGITVQTDFEFKTPLPDGAGPADLTFECVSSQPEGYPLPARPVFESPVRLESGAPATVLYRTREWDLLRYSEVADFYVSRERITCRLLDTTYDYMIEILLLGSVFAYWFERRGIPMLHASAVDVDGSAAVFIATNKGGKSSLAATLMQAGHPLLSDDLVGIEIDGAQVRGRPGYPSMRLWPDQAVHFAGSVEGLALAHPGYEKRRLVIGPEGFGSFCDSPRPFACFYLPERRETRNSDPVVEIVALSPMQAIIEFVRASFLPRTVHAAGFAAHRMAVFGRTVADVPVKQLTYPAGLEHLPRVREAILADLASSSAGRGRAAV